jgi:hypothetical protein
VQLLDAQAGQRALGELDGDLLDRGEPGSGPVGGDGVAVLVEVELVGLPLLVLVAGDPGTDDVDLVALLDLLADPVPDPSEPARVLRERHDVRLDRGPPRG